MIAFLLALTLQPDANADMLRIDVEGMICVSCETKIVKALGDLDVVTEVSAFAAAGRVCANAADGTNNAAIKAIVTELGYTVTGITPDPECEQQDSRFPANWADPEGLDVRIISYGEEVDLMKHAAEGKFTIYDFGAPWCGPCHVAEKMLKDYLREHDDVAVRAIVLAKDDPKASFAMPAATQHLQSAAGLPHFVVVSPSGKTVFNGSDVTRVLKRLDKKR